MSEGNNVTTDLKKLTLQPRQILRDYVKQFVRLSRVGGTHYNIRFSYV